MKIQVSPRQKLIFTGAALSAVLIGATASWAQDVGGMAPPPPPNHTQNGGPVDRHDQPQDVESRIKNLHDQLKITPDEESLWSPVAQVLRDNAATMRAAIKDRDDKGLSMTAPDDIRSFQAITAAHADGLQKLATAFSALYAAMPPAQQKNADMVFGHQKEDKGHGPE